MNSYTMALLVWEPAVFNPRLGRRVLRVIEGAVAILAIPPPSGVDAHGYARGLQHAR